MDKENIIYIHQMQILLTYAKTIVNHVGLTMAIVLVVKIINIFIQMK